jgi:hypothetical protein
MDVIHPKLGDRCDRWGVEHIGGVEETGLFVNSQLLPQPFGALLPAAERFTDEEINALASGVVYGSKSHKLGHPRATTSHRRPIYRCNDLKE